MRPTWVTQYLTIPFREKGRTHEGVDCYGLVRLIYQEQRQIELPSYTEDYTTTEDAEVIRGLVSGEVASRWQEIARAEASLFDGLIFRILGRPTHFGMVLDPPWFLHAAKLDRRVSGKVWLERWDTRAWEHRLLGVVRWQTT